MLAALSLSKAQLAKVLGVSRPTLYDWLNDREPKLENAQRLSTLLRLLSEADITSAEPLRPRFLRCSLGEGKPSLLEALCAEALDERLVVALMRELRALAVASDARPAPSSIGAGPSAEDEPTQFRALASRDDVPARPSEGIPDGAHDPWSAVWAAAASVTDAARWREALARALYHATQARFAVVVTCFPSDPFSSQSFVQPQESAPLVAAIQTRYLVQVERGADAMAHRACGVVYAPLLEAKNVALAEQLRRELLSPAGVQGMLNVFLGDAREGVLGWIALGLSVPCAEALRLHGAPLAESAACASRTLTAALALGRGCGLVAQRPLPLTARERQIVSLLLDGYSDANIAALLQLSEETVGTHLRRVYRKLGVHSRLELSARLRG